MNKIGFWISFSLMLLGCSNLLPRGKNRPPNFLPVEDQKSLPDSEFTIPFMISDEKSNDLKIIANSSDQTLIKNDNLKIEGIGNKRKLIVKTELYTGKLTINLSAQDHDNLISSTNFDIIISAKSKIKDIKPSTTSIIKSSQKDHIIIGSSTTARVMRYINGRWIIEFNFKQKDPKGTIKDVAISENHAAIGVNLSNGASILYIFQREGEQWIEQSKLSASSYEDFRSIAISGEYIITRIKGKAVIFQLKNNKWQQFTSLNSSDKKDRSFGSSFDIQDDYAIIGSSCGKAYIFNRLGNVWREQAILNNNIKKPCYTPSSVAISDHYAITSSYGSSYAYIFKRDGSTWNKQSKLSPPDSILGNYFGESVDISNHLAIVSYLQNDYRTGSIYVFRNNKKTWEKLRKISSEDSKDTFNFGKTISILNKSVLTTSFPSLKVNYISLHTLHQLKSRKELNLK